MGYSQQKTPTISCWCSEKTKWRIPMKWRLIRVKASFILLSPFIRREIKYQLNSEWFVPNGHVPYIIIWKWYNRNNSSQLTLTSNTNMRIFYPSSKLKESMMRREWANVWGSKFSLVWMVICIWVSNAVKKGISLTKEGFLKFAVCVGRSIFRDCFWVTICLFRQ